MVRQETPSVPEPLAPAVAAMIFAADEPVHLDEISSALGGVDVQRVEEAILTLERLLETMT